MEKSYKIDKKEGNGISAPGMGDRSMLDLHSRFFADVHVRVSSAQKIVQTKRILSIQNF